MTRVEGGVVVRADHDGLAIAGCPSLDPSTRLRVNGPSRKWIYAIDASTTGSGAGMTGELRPARLIVNGDTNG